MTNHSTDISAVSAKHCMSTDNTFLTLTKPA